MPVVKRSNQEKGHPDHCASCAAKTKQIPARIRTVVDVPSPAPREKVPKVNEGLLN
jgi:hypothetical protein